MRKYGVWIDDHEVKVPMDALDVVEVPEEDVPDFLEFVDLQSPTLADIEGWLARGESSPRHPDPRCHECRERLGDADRAEVYLDPDALRANAGGQWVMVDDIPESAFGPFLVHADPCSQVEVGGHKRYVLA